MYLLSSVSFSIIRFGSYDMDFILLFLWHFADQLYIEWSEFSDNFWKDSFFLYISSELVTNISIKSKSTALKGQLDDAAVGGLRGIMEEGQGDAPLTMTLQASEISTNGKPHQQ